MKSSTDGNKYKVIAEHRALSMARGYHQFLRYSFFSLFRNQIGRGIAYYAQLRKKKSLHSLPGLHIQSLHGGGFKRLKNTAGRSDRRRITINYF
jgi:hypothetical protein